MSEKTVHLVIRGRVQGVWYRDSMRREAEKQGVSGWVRNRADGSVEAVFAGPAATVDEMVRWCEHGPANAEVSGIEVTDAPDESLGRSFNIRY